MVVIISFKAKGKKNHRPYNLKSLIGEGFVQKIEKNKSSPISYLHCLGFLSPTLDPFLELIVDSIRCTDSSRCTDPPEGKRWSLRLQVTFEPSCHLKIFWYLNL